MDVNAFTSPFQLTRSMHRDLYPALDPKNPDLLASGKKVIITGAGGQIGSDCAVAWAMAGAAGVALVGRNAETLNTTAEKVKAITGSTIVSIHSTDVTSESEVKTLYEKIGTQLGGADVLINNAATMNTGNTGDIEPALWWQDFESNVKGPYLLSHYFIKHFSDKGTIINLASSLMGLVMPGTSSYAASKLAMTKTSEFLQSEHPNLRLFCCMPGIVESQITLPMARPFALDKGILTGAMSLYLSTPKADYLKGGLVSVNWDILEMEQHKDEIVENRLLSLAFLNAKLGPEGQIWKT